MSETSPPTRRHWFRFSLRSLFICITLVAILMAWVTYERAQSRRELDIANLLSANGATVDFRGRFDDLTQTPAKQSWWRTQLGNIVGVRIWSIEADHRFFSVFEPRHGLEHLRELCLLGSEVNDLSPIAGFTNLVSLHVNGTHVCDLRPIAGLTNLQDLGLHNTDVADLTPLAGLNNLEWLGLTDTKVSDLTPLARLHNLEWLDLSFIQVSDEQLRSLQQALPNCKIIR